MKYGSVCSGIEAASVAWEPLGWEPAWFAEIEPGPSSVLSHRWPHVPNLGDMTKVADLVQLGLVDAPDVLVGGTPCQSFSFSGKRGGLSDERGQLTLAFIELADIIDEMRIESGEPECVVAWENVPGVLNTKDNAFGHFLAGLAGEEEPLQPPRKKWSHAGLVSGPRRSVAWRILDAQYFGLAQRRRRVFVIASAREEFDPAAVLFEPEGVRRDTAPRRPEGEEVARSAEDILGAGCWWDGGQVSQTLDAVLHKGQTMPEKNRFPAVIQPIAFPAELSGTQCVAASEVSPPLSVAHKLAVCTGTVVRKIMPVEGERLQGFPRGYTAVPHGKKLLSDTQRYKAIGNSKPIPVVHWIGRRIQLEVEKAALD